MRELAWQIEQISALTDLDRGTTVNVGVVGGGTQSNVVAASAWADIDLGAICIHIAYLSALVVIGVRIARVTFDRRLVE